jgi:translation initiation factor IF-2
MTQPKKRVYELARELNMTNKALLEKISSLDLGLNSHMSTLDDGHEATIRQFIQGGPEPELEEKRVQPTVIRRRRKAVEPSAEEAGSVEEAGEVEVETIEPDAIAEADTQPAETEEPAREEETEQVEAVEAIEAVQESEPETVAEAPAEEVQAAGAAESVDEPVEVLTQAEAETEPVGQPAAPAPAPEKEEPVKAKPKKKKKEAAAKIIKLPERPPVTAPAPEPEAEESAPAAPKAAAEPSKSERPKKKARKRAVAEEEAPADKKFLKKKISFRKKEVVEGADLYDRVKPRKGRKGGKSKAAPVSQKTQITTAKAIKRRIRMDDTIVLSDLAKRMGIKSGDMISKLMLMGVMVTVNQTIDFDTATLVAGEFGYEIERASFEEETILQTAQADDPEKMASRPPVVTIMGHVDHGKTSLLDVIRKSRVTAGEAGGITQHIGAYLVSTEKGGNIVFLDTPGHEAFSAMRSRGAHITDLVILVVAADDGVMPQTVEAINHAKAAKVPILVAVNKIDKADANPDRVQRQLAEIGVTPEEWGGDTIFVQVSAKKQIGIDNLLEMILLQAELLELKANPDKLAVGNVVEAKLDSGRGPVATVLVKEGTLKAGDAVVCGVHHGKVRALLNDLGVKVDSAGPSHPVEIIGLSGVPMAGDEMVALKDEKDAKQVSQHRIQKQRAKELAKTSRLSLDKLFERMQEGEVKELNLIIKADVDGSMEAIRDSLLKLSNPEVSINIIHSATGTITESDISLAAVSEAIIIGFNVRPNPKVQEMASEEKVDIRYHNIIYNVIQEIKDAIVGMMKSTFEERSVGRAEVREVFHVPKVGTIAGCYVTDGKIERGQLTRLIRDGIVVYEGKNSSLRRYKDDAKEVQSGYECGVALENFNDIKIGDIIECYYMEEIRPEMV